MIHDQTVDRTTHGRSAASALALEELRRLDAGRWLAPECAGERIPLLDEALELIRGRALLQLGIKNGPVCSEGIEQRVLDAVGRHGMQEDVLPVSSDHVALRNARAACPRVATGILDAARLIDGPAAARAAGLGFTAWTVDDETVCRRCQARGVDGIVSNDTRMLGRLLEW